MNATKRTKRAPKSPPGTLGYAVFERREEKGLTQDQLAEKAKIGQSQVSAIENGSPARVRAKTLLWVATALDCDPYALFHGKIVKAKSIERVLLNEKARRLEYLLTDENRAKWIAYGEGLLDAQPKEPDPVVEAVREQSKRHPKR